MDADSVVINIDIDTTGLNVDKDQVCRIFAFDNDIGYEEDSFSIFMMPMCDFTVDASLRNKFTIEGGFADKTLLLRGKPVTSVSQEEGFREVYAYIRSKGKCTLISHCAKIFLAQFLVIGFKKYLNLSAEELDAAGIKFSDSYLMIKPKRHILLRGIENLKEPTIYQYLFPAKKRYKTPNARNDTIALRKILAKLEITSEMIRASSFLATEVFAPDI